MPKLSTLLATVIIKDLSIFGCNLIEGSDMNQIFKLIITVVLILSIHDLSARQRLSPQADISVMTLGPYQGELYSAFGHSAFRVYDPVNRINHVFDYGRFSLQQEGFYWNFARGIMLYQLGDSQYNRFKNRYVKQNRFVYEQVLNLTPAEKQELFNYLLNNIKPENRSYYYNYVYDNCATKIKDVLQAVLKEKVVFDTSYVEKELTLRGLMDRYCTEQYWGDLAIDLGLGIGVDKVASPDEYLFLPDYVYRSFEKSSITDENGSRPLISRVEKVNEASSTPSEKPFLTPFTVFTILFFIVGFLTNINFKKDKRTKWIDIFVFGISGLFGFVLLFLWFGTDHISEWNFNLIWALPTHLIILFFINNIKYKKLVKGYFKYNGIIGVLLILVWAFLPQPLHTSLVPWILVQVLRSFYLVHDLRK